MREEKRHEMMETLFGAESEESDEEPEAFARPQAAYSDDEAEGGGRDEAESEGERVGSEFEKEESEAERVESEAEREDSDVEHGYREGSQAEQTEMFTANERTRVRHQISVSASEQSNDGHQLEDEEDEVEQVREPSEEGDDQRAPGGAADMHAVFGDSDEEEQEIDDQQRSPQVQAEVGPSDDEANEQGGIRPEDIVPDEEQQEEPYDSDDDQPAERRAREKLIGPPMHIDIPFCPPPGQPDKMHVVRVSNIMGIDSRPFDPKTYIEEESFVMDESGNQQRLRLEDNVARWRLIHNRDGTISYESNARFVKWSDGSMQLLIGNEVLDHSVQKAHQDQAHLFLRHSKGILQSQGRLLQKMKFMPSSLASKSHRLLSALVDSRNKKVYKVKNLITDKDPEREKEETEKLEEQRIRSKEDLQRKQDKISRKYTPARERVEPQLSPGFLEGALEEEEEADDYNDGGKLADAQRFQEQLEAEDRAEKRIINAKRSAPLREPAVKRGRERNPSPPSDQELEDRFSEESEREASEYESEGQEDDVGANELGNEEDQEEDPEDEEDEDEQGEDLESRWEDAEDETSRKRRDREDDFENDASPPRKPVQRRRVVVSDSEEED